MSSNGNFTDSNDNGGNNGGNNNSDFIVAAVALVVSVVALLATFMQVLQQYMASAQGYSQCNRKVMGDWARTKTRRFQWSELRFEVQFDAPVIFVSPPTNKNGPVPDADIFFLDGTNESLDATWTTKDMDLRKEYKLKSEKERIHTADNERASWWILLYAIQRMEAKSREWQEAEYTALGPPDQHRLPQRPPSLKDHHTLTVALQRKRKSWDTMPTSVIKPYATTTMCHLIEITAALGVYWKEFDRKRDRYWAEGNGFMVLGGRLSDLGLMFSFQVSGQGTFERNRVIPVDEIKELCFGYVPTIYREKLDQRRLKPPSDEQQSLSSLQMGSAREITETLTLIGCNNNTVSYFWDKDSRTSHLFPVSFEILGMLSRTFHIENSSFTYIPNPTPDRWDKRSVSFPQMLKAYKDELEKHRPEDSEVKLNRVIADRLKNHIEQILKFQDDPNGFERLPCLNALHMALEDADEILTGKPKTQTQPANGNLADHAPEVFSSHISDAERQKERRGMVQDVLRHHIQEVMRLLNSQDDRMSETLSVRSGMQVRPRPIFPASNLPTPVAATPGVITFDFPPTPPPRRFEEMNAAGPDERQEIFMEVYFNEVRSQVVLFSKETTGRRISIAPGGGRTLATGSIRSRASSIHVSPHDLPNSTVGQPGPNNVHERSKNEATLDNSQIPLADLAVGHEDIWCTLVFKMICWLMLHNFNKKDIQVPKSELLGSRMPVYIA